MSITFQCESVQDLIEEAVAILNQTRTSHVADEDRCRWLYLENPAGAAAVWTARHRGELVGFAALIPREFWLMGVRHLAWNTADLSVLPEFRRQGIAASLRQKAREHMDQHPSELLYGNPNSKSQGAHRKAGLHCVGDMVRHVRVLSPGAYLNKWLPGKTAPRFSRFLNQSANALFNVALPIPIAKNLTRKISIADIDTRFSQLAAATRDIRPIVGVRDSAYLKWRYGQNPTETFHIFICEDNDQLLGYVVVRRHTSHLELMDLFPSTRMDVCDSLLATVMDFGKNNGCSHLVATWLTGHPLLPRLRWRGFVKRPGTSSMFSYTASSGDLARYQRNPASWYFTAGDRDI